MELGGIFLKPRKSRSDYYPSHRMPNKTNFWRETNFSYLVLKLICKSNSHKINISFCSPFITAACNNIDIILVQSFQLDLNFFHIQSTGSQPMHQKDKIFFILILDRLNLLRLLFTLDCFLKENRFGLAKELSIVKFKFICIIFILFCLIADL